MRGDSIEVYKGMRGCLLEAYRALADSLCSYGDINKVTIVGELDKTRSIGFKLNKFRLSK